MKETERFSEDPFDARLREALRAEREDMSKVDVSRLRSRMLAGIAAGAPAPSLTTTSEGLRHLVRAAPLPVVLTTGVVLVAVSAILVARLTTFTPTLAPALAPPPAPLPAPAAASFAPTGPVAPVTRSSTATPPRHAVRGAVPRPPSSAASSAHASAPRTTSLGDETRRYERAAAALRAGEPIAAAEELRAYLARYPQGTLRDEARLSLLEARFAAGDFRGARDLAVELAADDALRSRRREIVEVLVRAQIALGACDAARVSLDARDARGDAAALREELSRCDEREPEQ